MILQRYSSHLTLIKYITFQVVVVASIKTVKLCWIKLIISKTLVLRRHGHILLPAMESLQWVYQDQILTADSWGYDRVLTRKCLWNNYNLYLYSSGSAAKRFNERKITTGQNNPRNTKLSLFWGSPRPQDCHEKNFILM